MKLLSLSISCMLINLITINNADGYLNSSTTELPTTTEYDECRDHFPPVCLADPNCCVVESQLPFTECYTCSRRECSSFTSPIDCLSNPENCNWNEEYGACVDGPTQCKDLTSSDFCEYTSSRLDCCWDNEAESCLSCDTYCPTISAFQPGAVLDNCGPGSDDQCCITSDYQSCESCNFDYDNCTAIGTFEPACDAAANRGCIFLIDEFSDGFGYCADLEETFCYELGSRYCEYKDECCYAFDSDFGLEVNRRRDLDFVFGASCRRCDNCTERFPDYERDSCSCFSNEEACCVADITFDRNCEWIPDNTTNATGYCDDRYTTPAPTYLGMSYDDAVATNS